MLSPVSGPFGGGGVPWSGGGGTLVPGPGGTIVPGPGAGDTLVPGPGGEGVPQSRVRGAPYIQCHEKQIGGEVMGYFYHPRMRIGNNFIRVCLSVCLCVCVSVCLSVSVSVCSGYNF